MRDMDVYLVTAEVTYEVRVDPTSKWSPRTKAAIGAAAFGPAKLRKKRSWRTFGGDVEIDRVLVGTPKVTRVYHRITEMA